MNQAQVEANVNPLIMPPVAFVTNDTLPEGKVSLSALWNVMAKMAVELDPMGILAGKKKARCAGQRAFPVPCESAGQ